MDKFQRLILSSNIGLLVAGLVYHFVQTAIDQNAFDKDFFVNGFLVGILRNMDCDHLFDPSIRNELHPPTFQRPSIGCNNLV